MGGEYRLAEILAQGYGPPVESKPQYHSSLLRKGRFSQRYGLYHITKNLLEDGHPDERQRIESCEALQYFREINAIYLHAFVIMPDHWHAPWSITEKWPLDTTVHELCRRMSYPSRQRGSLIPWQEGFHDHKVREDDSVVDIVRYIENNPVDEGLVDAPDEWAWSSAHPNFSDELDRTFLGHERWVEK